MALGFCNSKRGEIKAMYRKGVLGIIVNKDKKFLILYRALHWNGWEFPKGGIEKGETEEEALLREIKEETGLDAKIVCRLPYEIAYDYPESFLKKTKTEYAGAKQSVYLLSADGAVKLSAEHRRFSWLPYSQAMKMLKQENQKKALDAAGRHISQLKNPLRTLINL